MYAGASDIGSREALQYFAGWEWQRLDPGALARTVEPWRSGTTEACRDHPCRWVRRDRRESRFAVSRMTSTPGSAGKVGAHAVREECKLMIERTEDIVTRDGAMETFICHPERGGASPGVLFLMDAPGIRDEL
jgi:hypothetical protein